MLLYYYANKFVMYIMKPVPKVSEEARATRPTSIAIAPASGEPATGEEPVKLLSVGFIKRSPDSIITSVELVPKRTTGRPVEERRSSASPVPVAEEYVVISGITLINVDEDTGNLTFSQESYCFKDREKFEQYLTLKNAVTLEASKLQKAKQEGKEEAISAAKKRLTEMKSLLESMNKEITSSYESRRPGTAYDGCVIKRYDERGRPTNLTASTKKIDINTLGMGITPEESRTGMDISQKAIRVQIATKDGETFVLQFQVDSNGKLIEKSLNPITLKGARMPTIIPNPEDTLGGPENNRKILETFREFDEFVVNGKNYKSMILGHFQQLEAPSLEALRNAEVEGSGTPTPATVSGPRTGTPPAATTSPSSPSREKSRGVGAFL